jgi:hypothetical protein
MPDGLADGLIPNVPLLCASNYAKSTGTGRGTKVWRDAMADHGELEYATATGNDYPAHEQQYRNFLTLVRVVLSVIVIIVIGMAIFLT